MSSSNRAVLSYNERIHDVIDYIHAHLSDVIKLETLASVACFSAFHFHRIFTAFTGETPHQYIERRRMETAARLLYTKPSITVSEVASDCGFSTISAFSRTFKKYFDVPPSQFLIKHIHEHHTDSLFIKKTTHSHSRKMKMPVRIQHIKLCRVAYIQTLNGYANGIPKAWNKLLQFAQINNLLQNNTQLFGIPFDNPDITPKEKCQYRACITVPDSINYKRGEIKTTDLDAGTYAVFHFEGTTKNIAEAYAYIYGDWLPKSGNIPDKKPLLEIYPLNLMIDSNPDILKYDIALPVTAL